MNQLANLHILVTRPEPQGRALCLQIEERGGRALSFPTIAFAPPPDMHAFQEAIAKLGQQDWLIFISPQAVSASLVAMRSQWPVFPSTLRLAAVGAGTAKALQAAGYNVTVCPRDEWSSEALLDLPDFQSVVGKHIAIIRGVGGRELIDRTLAERGAHVLPVMAYQRVLPPSDTSKILPLLEQKKINIIICTSFEGVRNLTLLLGDSAWPYLKELPLIVMSERIKVLAHDLGFQTIWVTPKASSEAILDVIVQRKDEL